MSKAINLKLKYNSDIKVIFKTILLYGTTHNFYINKFK